MDTYSICSLQCDCYSASKEFARSKKHEKIVTHSVTKFFVVTVRSNCETEPRRRAQKVMLMAQICNWQKVIKQILKIEYDGILLKTDDNLGEQMRVSQAYFYV